MRSVSLRYGPNRTNSLRFRKVMMRAVLMREFGPPDVLQPAESPGPETGELDVVVNVEIANITFVDTQIRAGRPPNPAMTPVLPTILGNGVGGFVASAGPKVGNDLIGRRVVTSLGGSGGYAELAVAPANRIVAIPDGVSMRDAVALLADGRTALSLLRIARVSQGETVLVEAAAGGVGTLLVQLAGNLGARVVAVAGGERKLALARELGADVTIDYLDDRWAQRVRDAVGSVDVVFDGVGGAIGASAFGLLHAGGRFCPFGMASGRFTPISAQDVDAGGVTVLRGAAPSSEELVALTRDVLLQAAAGRVRPVVGQQFVLEDAAAAHAAIEARTTLGKTLLVVR